MNLGGSSLSIFEKLEKPYYKQLAKCRACGKPYVMKRKTALSSLKYYCEVCSNVKNFVDEKANRDTLKR